MQLAVSPPPKRHGFGSNTKQVWNCFVWVLFLIKTSLAFRPLLDLAKQNQKTPAHLYSRIVPELPRYPLSEISSCQTSLIKRAF